MEMIHRFFAKKSVGLLILRVFVGTIFIIHGVQKFMNAEAMVGFFAQIGLNSFWMYTVATVETVGGAALVLGFFTPVAAALLSIVLICAIYFFKSKIGAGSWLTQFAASELDLSLLGANLALIFTGSGKFSLGRYCMCWCHKKGVACKVCPWIGCERHDSCDCGSDCSDCKGGTCDHSHDGPVVGGQM